MLKNKEDDNAKGVIFEKAVKRQLFGEEAQKDSDNDGLKDWEEVLWKTDPNNPDTDGDGTPDGEEVALNRSPIVAGPDDDLANLEARPLSEEGFETGFDSLTADLSKQFLANYLILKQTALDGVITEEMTDSLVNSFISGIQSQQPKDKYQYSDLKISENNSKQAIRNYGNKLGAVIKKYSAAPAETEFEIFNRAAETGNEQELQKLDEYIDAFGGIIKDALDLEIPKEAEQTVLVFINSVNGMLEIDKRLQNFFSDPLGAMTALEQYPNAASTFFSALVGLDNYFIGNAIIFNEEEGGYFIKQLAQLVR